MTENEKTLEVLSDLANGLEAVAVKLKHAVAELASGKPEARQTAAVKEETFTSLKFEPQEGAKIGAYDVAYKANNVEQNWTSALNILKQSNATIEARYHGQGYVYSYWLYGEGKIYRQKLKQK
jgi:hypothetical protein